jgi:hypothetical protein
VAPTDDPARAARRIMTDDGFNIGVLYKGARRTLFRRPEGADHDIEDLECAFGYRAVLRGFMSRAYTIEAEAVERYTQFADQLEGHNNSEVAAVFPQARRDRGLAREVHPRRDELAEPAGAAGAVRLERARRPGDGAFDSLHYLMQPYHALEIALRCEIDAVNYFETSPPAPPMSACAKRLRTWRPRSAST